MCDQCGDPCWAFRLNAPTDSSKIVRTPLVLPAVLTKPCTSLSSLVTLCLSFTFTAFRVVLLHFLFTVIQPSWRNSGVSPSTIPASISTASSVELATSHRWSWPFGFRVSLCHPVSDCRFLSTASIPDNTALCASSALLLCSANRAQVRPHKNRHCTNPCTKKRKFHEHSRFEHDKDFVDNIQQLTRSTRFLTNAFRAQGCLNLNLVILYQ